MTGTQRTTNGLPPRRKKALFRSWHRGMREVDLVLGTFADAAIGALTDEELDQSEALLDLPDGDLLSWIMGERALPAGFDTPIFRRIMDFRRSMTF